MTFRTDIEEGERMTEELREVLRAWFRERISGTGGEVQRLADDLLSIVLVDRERHARERAARPLPTPGRRGWANDLIARAEPGRDRVGAIRRVIEGERESIRQGICPSSGGPIMPNGILRPACAACDCGEDE